MIRPCNSRFFHAPRTRWLRAAKPRALSASEESAVIANERTTSKQEKSAPFVVPRFLSGTDLALEEQRRRHDLDDSYRATYEIRTPPSNRTRGACLRAMVLGAGSSVVFDTSDRLDVIYPVVGIALHPLWFVGVGQLLGCVSSKGCHFLLSSLCLCASGNEAEGSRPRCPAHQSSLVWAVEL